MCDFNLLEPNVLLFFFIYQDLYLAVTKMVVMDLTDIITSIPITDKIV